MSVAAVASVIAEQLSVTPTGVFADACHTATGGNPFLLQELMGTLLAEGVRPDGGQRGARVGGFVPEGIARLGSGAWPD